MRKPASRLALTVGSAACLLAGIPGAAAAAPGARGPVPGTAAPATAAAAAAAAASPAARLVPFTVDVAALRTAGADRPDCTKDLLIMHTRTKRFLDAEAGYRNAAKGMLRATLPRPTARHTFEICVVSAKDDSTLRVYLRSAKMRKFVTAEPRLAGRQQGMVRANAGALGPNANFLLYLRDNGNVYLRAGANNKFVTVERAFRGSQVNMVRAARNAKAAGEVFTIYHYER